MVSNYIDNNGNKTFQVALAIATSGKVGESKMRIMSAKENHPSGNTSDFCKRLFTITVVDEGYYQLKRCFTGYRSILFGCLFIIQVSMKILEAEADLKLWEDHWS